MSMAPSRRTGDLRPRRGGAEADGKKPRPGERVWSPADEVRILEGVAAHARAHGEPPRLRQLRAALAGRGLDKAEFTVSEIYEKVRRLRNRYRNLRRRAGGVAPGHGDADDDEVRKYELSAAIWGEEASGPERKAAKRGERGFEEMRRLYPNLVVAVESIVGDDNRHRPLAGAALKRAVQLMDDQEAAELDARVKKHRVLESRMAMRRNTVRKEVVGTLIQSMD